jgi:thiamine kinase-like enzyme
MNEQRVERIIAQIPGWDPARLTISPLVGGITNQNFRVDRGEETYVLRIGGQNTQLLGIDRRREYTCTAIAARLGVGAEVVRFIAAEDALVSRFIFGAGVSPEAAARPATLLRIVSTIKRYHAGPAFPGTFSPFATVRAYHALALERGAAFPASQPRVFALMERIEDCVGALSQPRPCHNDLLASNFIDDGETIWILDWEYAGMGDIFFDLGNFAVNQSLDDDQCGLLLHYYFGEVRLADVAHLHLMRLASDLREAFWGFLQIAISDIDFDYQGYAQRHLERFLQNVATPRFSQWLSDARSP